MEKAISTETVDSFISSNPFVGKPDNLYDAMNYIMQIGGKRMRPQLLLLGYFSQGGKIENDAMNLALAIETFHNFSLVHDDIMDNAPFRRGLKTVHEKWDMPTAILAGDNLLIKCYELILNTSFENKVNLLKEFSSMAFAVCEGQQMDMDLPQLTDISEQDYLKMIEYKTAVLPACALKMGAMAAGANQEISNKFYEFGIQLGLAFQLQDDFLDCFGTFESIGKQVGGDILENKKTILFLNALQNLENTDKINLIDLFKNKTENQVDKIEKVKTLFEISGSRDYLLEMKKQCELKALKILNQIEMNVDARQGFMQLFDVLQKRNN